MLYHQKTSMLWIRVFSGQHLMKKVANWSMTSVLVKMVMAKKFPQTKKLKEAATVSRSKLEWTQVDPSVESCSDGISSSEETNSGSPSVLCEAGVASQDLKCLCARKEDAVKLVCGECRLSLKL